MQLVTLDELLAQSDFISIHMPKTPETVGMLGAESFKKMKSTAYVVNVARGGLVDEEALYAALEAGEIAGAGVDVFVKEPSTDLPFFKMDNVVVTPHLGASTDEAQEKAGVSVATVRPPGPGRRACSGCRQRRRRRDRPGRPAGHRRWWKSWAASSPR